MSFPPNPAIVDARGGNFTDIRGNQIYNFGSSKPDVNLVLAPVADATHTRRGPVSRCYPGTREDVIAELMRSFDQKGGRSIYWLNGPAGSGKSAIAQALAERLAPQGRLMGTFFFLRGEGARSTIARLVPTLSHQLSRSIPAIRSLIQSAIDDDPHITSQSLTYQFQKLVVEPILAATSHQSRTSWAKKLKLKLTHPSNSTPVVMQHPHAVMIIDALDECNDKSLMGEFIETIIKTFKENSALSFRVLITSRVEEHIRQKLDTPAALSTVHHLSLLNFDARHDIRTFMQSCFSTIYEENLRLMKNMLLPWPSKADLDSLVEKSDGSFIFAVTLMDFVQNGSGLPQHRLQNALDAEAGLDTLYTQVLADAPRNNNFERVLGTIMLLEEPLPIAFLARLLWLGAEDIVQTLLGMQSILLIPGNDDEAIRLFHTSLRDFLVSQARSGQFYVHPPRRHLFIATECIAAIGVQPEDIFYSKEQEYACLTWCHHLQRGVVDGGDGLLDLWSWDSIATCLVGFASHAVDAWVNTLLLHRKWEQLEALRLALSRLKQWLHCAEEFIRTLEGILRVAESDVSHFKDEEEGRWKEYFEDDRREEWAPKGFIRTWREGQASQKALESPSSPEF